MIVITLFLLLVSSVASAQQLAFPTAEGYGRFTIGGRGGYVCHVTDLTTGTTGALLGSDGHRGGSLKYCLNQSGNRTIVFDTSGTIPYVNDYAGPTNSNLTIAGQTAPSPGVLIKGLWFDIKANQTIMRYLVLRHGAVPGATSSSFDSLSVNSINSGIFDHLSLSWGPDEVHNFWQSTNLTLQWSIVSEGVKTPSGYGSLIGRASQTNASILHNLTSRSQARCFQVTARGPTQFVNNVIYNYRAQCNIVPGYSIVEVEYLNNHFAPGPASTSTSHTTLVPCGFGGCGTTTVTQDWSNGSTIYLDGNIHTTLRPADTGPEDSFLIYSGTNIPVSTSISGMPEIESRINDAFAARNDVLNKAGARIPEFSSVDQRIINDVINGTGSSILSSENEVGGFPTLAVNPRTLSTYDTDYDGIPNGWETDCSSTLGGLSPTDGTDGDDIITGIHANVNGYSKLEVYLNEVAGDYTTGTCGDVSGGGDTTPPTGVAIIAPTESQVVSGASQNYEATATDAESTITGVDFYQNSSLIGSDAGAPDCGSNYCIAWDTTLVTDGDKMLHAIATSEGGSTQSATVNVTVDNISSYTAIHTSSAPTINGNLSEFSSANLIEFDVVGGDTTDCKMMYDSTNLYVGCTTTDSNLTGVTTAHDDVTLFGEDSLEIVLDPNNSNGAWTSSDYKLAINIQNARYDAHTQSNTAWTYGGATAVAFVGDIDGVADDTSWTVEASIPWASISVTPSTSTTYAMNLQINDKDGTASTVRYRWNGTSSNNLSDAMDVTLGEPVSGGDTTDPTVSIVDPLDGATIGSTYTIRADAQDASGIFDVQFYRDTSTAICSADTSSPFECILDTTALSEGSHTFHAVARDNVSPTPNDATSATITVTVDNTAPSNPSNLTLVSNAVDQEVSISLNWTASTDASGSIIYNIEKCSGASCSIFNEIDTSATNNYFDSLVSEHTDYCYQVLAIDAALNPSDSYSNTACIKTIDLAFAPIAPTLLQTTALSTVPFPTEPTDVGTSALGTIAGPTSPTGLGTTADPTITFPSPVTGVTSP